jgi:phage gp45-like
MSMRSTAAATLVARDPQRVEGPLKYAGVFRAFVVDVADPEKRGRVKVRAPHLHGPDIPTAVLPWAERMFPDGGGAGYGDYSPLAEHDSVFIMFEGGDRSLPIVVGTWYGRPGGRSELPAEVQTSIGQHRRRIVRSRHGSRIEIGDEPSDFEVKIVMPGGNIVHLRESDGGRGIHITTGGGHRLSLQDEQSGTPGPDTRNAYDRTPDNEHQIIPASTTGQDDFAGVRIRPVPLPTAKTANGVVQTNTPTAAQGFGQKGFCVVTSHGHRIEVRDVTNPGMMLTTKDGHKIEVLDNPNTLEMVTADANNRVRITQGGGILVECPGQTITMNAATFTLNASSQFTVNTPSFDVNES